MGFHFDPLNLVLTLLLVLLSIAFHEFAHCWTTDRLGDDTPRMQGRLSLNPLVHLDPMGTLMIVMSSLAGFGIGWGKPSPFNPYHFRHPARDRMLTALAGPISNLLQMLAWASLGALLSHWSVPGVLLTTCTIGVWVNAGLAAFNLLPIYPLDGHHILGYLIPALRPLIDHQAWMIVFLLLMLVDPLYQLIVRPAVMTLMAGAALLLQYLVGWPL
jgi:Zn-dependent protease